MKNIKNGSTVGFDTNRTEIEAWKLRALTRGFLLNAKMTGGKPPAIFVV
jgi:hypothetical protein